MNVNNLPEIPDIIISSDTSSSKILFQLEANFKKQYQMESLKDSNNKRRLELAERKFNLAQQEWNEAVNDHLLRSNILRNKMDNMKIAYQKDVKLFKLLDEHHPSILIDAYQLAQNATTEEINNFEEDNITEILARDLRNGEYGIFPSDKMDLWHDAAHSINNTKPKPIIHV